MILRAIRTVLFLMLILNCSMAQALEIVRQKNVATKIVFPLSDADGDTVTGAAGLDSEETHWGDGTTPTSYADLTNEATEIGTTGIYYLSLTSGEMNQDYVAIQVKTSTTGAKTQHILIRTIAGDPKAAATVTTAGNSIDVASTGEVGLDFSNIKDAGSTHTLTNITVPTVTDVTNAVGVKTGTGANQLDVTSGRIKADTVYWNASAVATPDTAGYPKVTHKTGTGTGEISLSSGAVTVGTNNDKTGYTASTVSDKTGYSLTQTFPTNFSSLSIDASGRVTPIPAESMIMDSGTAQAGASGSITLKSGSSSTDDLYKGLIVKIYGGTGVGQSRTITGYTGSTKVATVAWNWTTNPDSSSTYALIVSGNPSINSSLQVSTTASDPWATALPGSYGAGTAGNILGNNLNATVSSRLASSSVPTNFSSMSIDSNGRVDISKWLGSAVNSLISGRVDSNAQIVGDKTGYSLTQTFPTNFSTLSIDGSGRIDLGKWIGTAPNALISGRVDSNAQVVGDKTGYSLTQTFPTNFSSLSIDASGRVTPIPAESIIWDSGTAQAGASGSITLKSGSSSTDDLYKGLIVKIYGGTGAGQSRTITGYTGSTKVATVAWNWITNPDSSSSYALVVSGNPSINSSLQVSTTASDPWATALPGSYGAGTAGKILGDNLNATVSSRLASSSVPTNFSSMSIDSNGRVDVSKWLGSAVNSLISGRVDSNAQIVGDKTGYSLTQTFPTNFSTLSIDGSGRIDLGKWIGTAPNALISGRVDSNAQIVGDKTGYSLTQSFPTNFSSLAITGGGAVTVGTNNDKTGYALTSGEEDAIVDKVWDELRSGHTTSGTFGQGVASVQGNVTGSVASVTAGVTVSTNNDKTGYRLSATGIDDVWDEVQSGHTTSGTFGKYLDAQVSSISGGSCPTASAIADQVWDETMSDHLVSGSTGNKLNSAGNASDPWSTSLPGSYGSGTAGKIMSDVNNATNGVKEGSSYTGIENMIRAQR